MNPPPLGNEVSLFLIELGFVLLAFALALCCGRAKSPLFSGIEGLFKPLARRRALSVLVIGGLAAGVRLLFLPLIPIPQPFITSDFSFLLAADTFAAGRLTNATHPMWVHLETLHVSHQPTYMSMYFPAQGLVLAAGKLLVGHPWWGVWASVALMCASICWMLQAWLPPGWAFLGGVLAVLRLGLFSYWADSYAGGAVAAIAGALVFGALPRIFRSFRTRDFLWMALGMTVLLLSRPYEGALISAPAVAVLCLYLLSAGKAHGRRAELRHWLQSIMGKRLMSALPPVGVLARRIVPAAVVLLLGISFLAYYDYRVFGNAFTLPYTTNRATYALAPHFLWQSPRPEPQYRHKEMRSFYAGWELDWFLKSRGPVGIVKNNAQKVLLGESFYLGFALAVPLLAFPRALRDKRIRFLLLTAGVFAAGMSVETWLLPHYAAPFTAILYAILLQCMRHLRAWRPGGRLAGMFLVRAVPTICILLVGLRLYAQPLHIGLAGDTFCGKGWFGTAPRGLTRANVSRQLEMKPEPQLAIVRYSSKHDPVVEWVYNTADIDRSKVVWARDMGTEKNGELLRYFRGRQAWLVEPDLNPPRISRYSIEPEPPSSQSALAANTGSHRSAPTD